MAKKPKSKSDETTTDAARTDESAAKGLPPKKIMLIAGGGVAALLVVAGVSLWLLGFFTPRKVEETRAPSADATAPQGQTSRRPPHFLDIPEMTVNLAGGQQNARPSYLRIRVALELADATVVPQIQPVMPRVQDTLQTFLRELRTSDLEGSAGVHRLREELGRRVNLVVQPARVEAILFRELLVQ